MPGAVAQAGPGFAQCSVIDEVDADIGIEQGHVERRAISMVNFHGGYYQ